MASPLEKLGHLLIRRGLISPAQLAECLKSHGGKDLSAADLEEMVVSRGYLTREALVETIRDIGPGDLEDSRSRDALPHEVLQARRDPKRVLQKYTLVRELGRGGMAVVYKAWDDFLQQFVALKVIRTQDAGLPDAPEDPAVAEFLREARTAVKLSHPHIVRVYELGRHDGRYFLSMEYVEGGTLAQLLHPAGERRGASAFYRDPGKFLAALRDAARALDHAHRHDPPIVHRDVKPQNILVDRSGRACVADFGLAKELRSGPGLTKSGMLKGTPAYMAPEQALARGGAVDARTDVYALGAVLYEFLAGVPPFAEGTEHEVLARVVSQEPARPADVLRAVRSPHRPPQELEKVCLKALEKARERRYASAAQFADEIDRYLSGQPVRARDVTRPERAWRWLLRRKVAAAAVAAAVAMAVVTLVALTHRRAPRTIRVEDPRAAALREGLARVETLAAEMRYEEAIRAHDGLLAAVGEGAERQLLRASGEDLRLQLTLLEGLAERARKVPQDYARFLLASGPLEGVRVTGATLEAVLLRVGGGSLELPWHKVAPRQFLRLVQDYWPDIEGRPALGLTVWCLRRGFSEEAAVILRRHGGAEADAQVRRVLEEVKANASRAAAQVDQILREAREALAAGDLIIARARFERVLTLKPADPDAARGLEEVENAGQVRGYHEALALASNAAARSEWDAARASLRRALEIKPGDVTARGLLAELDAREFVPVVAEARRALDRGDFDRARERFAAALRLKPGALEAVEGWISAGRLELYAEFASVETRPEALPFGRRPPEAPPLDRPLAGSARRSVDRGPARAHYASRWARRPRDAAEEAVLAALKWLARHQSADGSWQVQGYMAQCDDEPKCRPNPGGGGGQTVARITIAGGGAPEPLPGGPISPPDPENYHAGVTGLAVLAFLGAGITHQSRERLDGIPLGEVVGKALRWMISRQDPEGCVGSRNPRKYMLCHVVCAQALAEAYGMTGTMQLREPAQRAVDFLAAAQNPGKGWRYSYQSGDNDSLVTGWAVQALKAAELSGLSFPKSCYDGARALIDENTEGAYARTGYTHPGTGRVYIPGLNENFDHHEALTAAAVTARLLMDGNRGDPRHPTGCDLLLRDKPNWGWNGTDFHYWHQATLALFLVDGPAGPKWKAWHEDVLNALVKNQNSRSAGCKHGSWEVIDRWSGEGGRVYAAAINALTLETPYRFSPIPFRGKR